ncbi:MAG: NAD-dependent epimerase/dehydratase family protein [Dehalobacterium sp.]
MKILVTGAKGFVGKNLVAMLKVKGYTEIYQYDLDTDPTLLDVFTQDCDFVFHLAGINHSKDPNAFMKCNYDFTKTLLESLKKNDNKASVLITSTIQAVVDNPYGRSKKAGEELLLAYQKETRAQVLICRLPTLFGKWCRPNHNSIIATLCHNVAHGIPINISNPYVELNFAYIDDVVAAFIIYLTDGNCSQPSEADSGSSYYTVQPFYTYQLHEVIKMLNSFKESRTNNTIPDMTDQFAKKLYSTYLSYLPTDQFIYPLKMNAEKRGSLTEFIRTPGRGMVSVDISKPGYSTGNHWHNTRCGKFLVVSGTGIIRFRRVDQEEILEYRLSGDKLEAVDIPPGYTHSIENLGDTDLVTIMWVNEPMDPEHPDIHLEV